MSLTTIHGGSKTVVSSSTACAACKYQRKKCTKNCLLAPYFPQERQRQFLNAHRLFGVSNITKMLKDVEESQRDIAMQNLIFHANARAIDPVGGIYKILCDLKHKIECCQAEFNVVHQQLSMHRSLAHQRQMHQRQMQRQDLPFGCYSYGDLLEQDEEYVNVDGFYHHQNLQQIQETQQQQQLHPLNHETLQTSNKVKLEQEGISDPEQEGISDPEHNNNLNLLSQILLSS